MNSSQALPIRVGNKFRSPSGKEWKVIETQPGGKVVLFLKAESLFCHRLHREVIQWERLS